MGYGMLYFFWRHIVKQDSLNPRKTHAMINLIQIPCFYNHRYRMLKTIQIESNFCKRGGDNSCKIDVIVFDHYRVV